MVKDSSRSSPRAARRSLAGMSSNNGTSFSTTQQSKPKLARRPHSVGGKQLATMIEDAQREEREEAAPPSRRHVVSEVSESTSASDDIVGLTCISSCASSIIGADRSQHRANQPFVAELPRCSPVLQVWCPPQLFSVFAAMLRCRCK